MSDDEDWPNGGEIDMVEGMYIHYIRMFFLPITFLKSHTTTEFLHSLFQTNFCINLAFCDGVAGNRFYADCPAISKNFRNESIFEPVKSCERYMKTNPDEITENAYWKIRSVHVWERSLSQPQNETLGDLLRYADDDDVDDDDNTTGTNVTK